MDHELSYIINDLFEVRQNSDYNDFFLISKEEVAVQVANAERFVVDVEAYLSTQFE